MTNEDIEIFLYGEKNIIKELKEEIKFLEMTIKEKNKSIDERGKLLNEYADQLQKYYEVKEALVYICDSQKKEIKYLRDVIIENGTR